MTRFFLFLLLLTVFIRPSYAQDNGVVRITSLDVEEHYTSVEELYNGVVLDHERIIGFAAAHSTDDFIKLSKTTSNMHAGVKEYETDKEGFLELLRKTLPNLMNASLTVRIKNIQFINSLDTVEVSSSIFFLGDTLVPSKFGDDRPLGFSSVSDCVEMMRLVDGVLKTFKTSCSVNTTYRIQ